MVPHRCKTLAATCTLLAALVATFAGLAAPELTPEARMREGMKRPACLTCHPGEKDRAKLVDLSRCCDAHCQRCHGEMNKHHPVGTDVTETDKVSLPLLGKNRVGCISCHDSTTPAIDSRSWKSQSLFSTVFQSQRTYKTYYLRINNTSGKLCKACH